MKSPGAAVVVRSLSSIALLGAVLLLCLAGYVGWGFLASLPTLDGRHEAPGLSAPVRIVRDQRGVPHVIGESATDVYFGLGYAHAQDRFFQMDLMRRAGEGRLSELIGDLGFSADVQAHTRKWPALVRAQTAALAPPLRAALEAYAAGVNARLQEGLASPEHALLFAPAERWRVEDSMACGLALVADQTGSRTEEAWRAALERRLSAAQMASFFPAYPSWGPTVLPGRTGSVLSAPADDVRAGSNAWVVDGRHTESGAPLMAADPHIGLTAPAAFYLARLVSPEGEFVGATLPGAPFIVMGRGPAGAFAVTNGEIDAEDYVGVDAETYAEAAMRRETILVRGLFGRERRVVEVRDTAVGPIADPRYFPEAALFGEGAHVALRSAADDPDNHAFEALYLLGHATHADTVTEAARLMHAPALNLLFAGVNGEIGYALAGTLPRRGADGEWLGPAAEEERPVLLNPASGRIVSANNAPAAAPPFRGYFMPERALRISELLDQSPRHDASGFAAMQKDELSEVARRFIAHIAAARPLTARGRTLQSELAAWSGEMSAENREPLLYALWLRELGQAIYGDEIGPENGSLFPRPRVAFLLAVLEQDDQHWCDDAATARVETCADTAGVALDRAAAPAPPGNWGEHHAAIFEHPLMSSIPLLGGLYTIRQPAGGDGTTINMSRFVGGASFDSDFGAAYRAVYDLADPARSRFMLAPGQSGNPFSPYFRNLVAAWTAGETFEISGEREGGPPADAEHTLLLTPSAG